MYLYIPKYRNQKRFPFGVLVYVECAFSRVCCVLFLDRKRMVFVIKNSRSMIKFSSDIFAV